MVTFKLQKLVSEKLKEGKNSYDITYLDAVYNNVSNQNIKNTFLAKKLGFKALLSEDILSFYKKFTQYSSDKKNNKKMESLYNFYKSISKGKPSPKFFNYENYNGGTNSLDDFKGKYVYINLWATWCSFCKVQIPYLEEIEKKYLSKNIKFVSISMDAPKYYKAWRKMVKDKKLTGIQLIANEKSKFGSEYFVNGLPKYILIDPLGNIVTANAPRPSNKRLIKIFNELKI